MFAWPYDLSSAYSVHPANGSGPEFSTSFAALDREGLLGKVVLMRDLSREPSPDLRLFGVLSLDSHGIFMKERLLPVTRRPPSLVPVQLSGSGTVTTHGGLISPQTSESQFSATNNGFKPIDPTKVRRMTRHWFGYRSCRDIHGVLLFSFPRTYADSVSPVRSPFINVSLLSALKFSLFSAELLIDGAIDAQRHLHLATSSI